MEELQPDTTEADWRALLSVLQVIAERGRRIRLAQQATTVDNEPLAGDRSTVVDQQSALKKADPL